MGLTGQYVGNLTLTSLATPTPVDPTANFDWSASPPDPSFGRDYSVRWTGQVKPLSSESHTVILISDDGVRLWVHGQMLIND